MGERSSIRDLWDFQDPEGSEARFREATDRAERSGDPSTALEMRTQIARALGLQGDFEAAQAVLDRIEPELEAASPVARLRWLLEQGRVHNSSGDPERARPLFEEGWRLGGEIPHHDLAVDAAHMVAIVAPVEEKRAWNEAAMAHAESCGDPDAERWLGSLYNNMGWDAHDAGDYQEALRLHEKCWAWHRRRSSGWGERVAKWSVAKQLRLLGRHDEALAMQDELLSEYLAEEPGGEGFVHEEIAELLYAAGDTSRARPHFARAHEMLGGYDWIEPERLERLRTLGDAPPE